MTKGERKDVRLSGQEQRGHRRSHLPQVTLLRPEQNWLSRGQVGLQYHRAPQVMWLLGDMWAGGWHPRPPRATIPHPGVGPALCVGPWRPSESWACLARLPAGAWLPHNQVTASPEGSPAPASSPIIHLSQKVTRPVGPASSELLPDHRARGGPSHQMAQTLACRR